MTGLEQADARSERRHPPIANRVVCVDFDGTIVPWGPLTGEKTPFPGVVEAMQALKDAGYRIVILTSRASIAWAASVKGPGPAAALFKVQQTHYVENILRSHNIPFDSVTAEKVPAEAYFDDMAFRSADGSLTANIHEFLNRKEAA